MNILLVTSEYPPYGSGIANAVYEIKKHMSRKSARVSVLSRQGADMNVTSLFEILPGLPGLLPFWEQVARLIPKLATNYDALWLHSPLLINIDSLLCMKTMISFHSTYYGFYHAYKEHTITHLLPYYSIATKLEHHFLQKLSHANLILTAVSPSVANEVCRNGLGFCPSVVPNGFETNLGSEMLFDKSYARKILKERYRLSFSENEKILLCVGRITEAKQPSLLLQLFEAISSADVNVSLIIVGSGNLAKKVRKKACQHKVHTLEQVPHERVFDFLNAADAFISLSCYEGLPLAVLEAASVGLPLILSDIPSHKWLVDSKIAHGLLLDLHNVKLAKIHEFIDHAEKKVVPDPSSTRRFMWENVIEDYLTLLE